MRVGADHLGRIGKQAGRLTCPAGPLVLVRSFSTSSRVTFSLHVDPFALLALESLNTKMRNQCFVKRFGHCLQVVT